MQAEEHDLIKYMVLTYTYPILSVFREPKMAPFLPPFLHHDKYLYSRSNMRSRHDYDDKYLYSRSYSGSRADYDDKFLYSRSIHA